VITLGQEEQLEESKEAEPPIKIISGACSVGKAAHSCEDAFFISERGFGVADGVSGWNDYGFSSSAFSHDLMRFCKEEIDLFIKNGQEQQESKHLLKKMRRTGSYLSMESKFCLKLNHF